MKERGYEVIGVTMQTCGADCSSQSVWRRREEAAVGDAAEVARTLGISHVVLDFSGEFRHRVIDYFVEEYLHGRTPNPCNVCNRFVKWEALLRESARLGAGEIATGHYAKIHRLENGRFSVCRSAADAKDQTYALYDLTQEQLARTQMPVGDYTQGRDTENRRRTGIACGSQEGQPGHLLLFRMAIMGLSWRGRRRTGCRDRVISSWRMEPLWEGMKGSSITRSGSERA